MSAIVVLTGGGIKGAVAAARYAKEHELVLVHMNYGQASAVAEFKALAGLVGTFPKASAVALAFPHVGQLQRTADRSSPSTGSQSVVVGGTVESAAPLSPVVLRGLGPVLMAVGVQAALRAGSSMLVAGFSRHCDAAHLGMPSVHNQPNDPREFFHLFNLMTEAFLQPRSKLRIEVPLMDLTYAEVILAANRFQVPLDKTWTCDQPRRTPCGRCEPCKARERAFTEAGLTDPTATAVPSPAFQAADKV